MLKKFILLTFCSFGLFLSSQAQYLDLNQIIAFQAGNLSEINNVLISNGWVLRGEDSQTAKICGSREIIWVFRPTANDRGNAFVRLSKKGNNCSNNILLYQYSQSSTRIELRTTLLEMGMKLVETDLLEIKGDFSKGIREIYHGAGLTAESVVASAKTNEGKLVNAYFLKVYQTE